MNNMAKTSVGEDLVKIRPAAAQQLRQKKIQKQNVHKNISRCLHFEQVALSKNNNAMFCCKQNYVYSSPIKIFLLLLVLPSSSLIRYKSLYIIILLHHCAIALCYSSLQFAV